MIMIADVIEAAAVSTALEWLMVVASCGCFTLNAGLLGIAYRRSGALTREGRNGVLRIIADHDIRQGWHRLAISISLTVICVLFLTLPNAGDFKAVLLKIGVLGIIFHVTWKSWDDYKTGGLVSAKLALVERRHHARG